MKLIDWYIIRKYTGTFIFTVAIIMSIVVVFDVSEKLQDFIDKKAPMSAIIFDYYVNFVPFFANMISPLLVFISVIFFTAKLSSNSEIIAILSSGVSFYRLMIPYMVTASLIVIFSFFLSHFLIPNANKERLNFEYTYINNPYQNHEQNIHRQIEPNTYIYLERYNTLVDVGQKFTLEKFVDGNLVYKLKSEYIRWDTLQNRWQLDYFFERKMHDSTETFREGAKIDTVFSFDRTEFQRRITNIQMMTTPELNEFIAQETAKGADNIEYYLIEKYQRSSTPFATFILTVIGLAVSSRKLRGGIGAKIAIGLFLCFSYILFMQISNTFSTNGDLAPIIAVWIPNTIYTLIAIAMIRATPK